jgi:hypothetical protein
VRIIGLALLLALSVVLTGCDLYRTNEGVGVLGPNGGYFWCDNEALCDGTPG